MIFFPDESDILNLKDLWNCIFKDEEDFVDMFMEKYFKKGNAVAYKKDDKIIAMVYFFWGEIADSSSKKIKTSFLYAVGTHPDYRKKGYMKKLLEFAFDYNREKGCEVCLVVSALDCMGLYETSGMKKCSELDVITIFPEEYQSTEISVANMKKEEFLKHRNSYLLSKKKSLIWESETADFIGDMLLMFDDILQITFDENIYYATVSKQDDHIFICETSIPIELMHMGVSAISNYYKLNLPFKIYTEVNSQNYCLFSNVETMYYGHGINLIGNYDFDNCYINLIAE